MMQDMKIFSNDFANSVCLAIICTLLLSSCFNATGLGDYVIAKNVSNGGQIVGVRLNTVTGVRGFVYNNGQFATPDVPNGQVVVIKAVNEIGTNDRFS